MSSVALSAAAAPTTNRHRRTGAEARRRRKGRSTADGGGRRRQHRYAYDKVSNRTQEVRTGTVPNTGTIDYTYNAADQLTQTVKGGNTTTYTYDANGDQTSAGGRTFTYNLADQLASTTNAGTTTTYGYDGDGRRVASTVGGGGANLRLVWDALADSGIPELALERTTAGGLVRRYLNGPLGAFSYTESGDSCDRRDNRCLVARLRDSA